MTKPLTPTKSAANGVQTIEIDGKPVFAVLPWRDYETLRDAAKDHAEIAALEAFNATDDGERIPMDVVSEILDGGNPVRAYRRWRGLTAAQLAERAGITAPYLSQIETGKRDGTIGTVRRIAKALDLPLDLLIETDED